MKILFISPLNRDAPSSIHRCKMVGDELSKHGYHISEIYNSNKYEILTEIRKSDIIIFQRYAYFSAPFLLIVLKALNKNAIFDFDDSIFSQIPIKKFKKIKGLIVKTFTNFMIRYSDYVVVGSHFLKEYSNKFNENVILIPTPVDSKLFSSQEKIKPNTDVIIGLFGSGNIHLNYIYGLKNMLNKLNIYTNNFKLFMLTGNKSHEIKDELKDTTFEVEYGPPKWIPFEEIPQHLSKLDINLYYLPDDEWSKGKCGTRMLETMSMGIPSVASNIGENSYIIEDGIDGFLAKDFDEFEIKLRVLIENKKLREDMGGKAISKINELYSTEVVTKKYIDIIVLLAKSNGY